MAILSRKQINARPSEYKDIPVPEWGGDVRIVPMSASDLQLFLETRESNTVLAGTQVLARVMVDDTGARLYSDEEVPELAALPGTASVMATLLPEILAFSGVDKARQEELTKKSASRSGVSSTD
jgi:hypothetical protein